METDAYKIFEDLIKRNNELSTDEEFLLEKLKEEKEELFGFVLSLLI